MLRFFTGCILGTVLMPAASPAAASIPDSAFVQSQGTSFVLDGHPFHAAGANCYYLMVYAADSTLRDEVDEVLTEVAAMDLNVVRTWGFNDGGGWNALQTAPGVYDERVFRGLDYVLNACSERGIRVILPLVNNWVDYGGMDQYVSWSETASFHDDFYTDANCRAWYKDHASALINRVNTINGRMYRDDPTILAWELANEGRCPSDPSGDTLQLWVEEMSLHIQGLDGNHLVGTGSEGFYDDPEPAPWYLDGSEGVDFLRNHQTPTIDYAGSHNWPDHWGLTTETAVALLTRQMDDARQIIGKPYVLGEFGKLRDGVSTSASGAHYDPDTYFSPGVTPRMVRGARPLGSPMRLSSGPVPASTTLRDQFYSDCFTLLLEETAGGGVYWISYHDTYPDYDGFGVYYPADASTVTLIEAFADAMNDLTRTGTDSLPPITEGPVFLGRAHPNPFGNALTIPLTVDHPSGGAAVRIAVFNTQGQEVAVLRDGYLENGEYAIPWSGASFHGKALPGGVYFYGVQLGDRRWARQVTRIP